MKHTDFYKICENLKQLEEQELVKAVQAHGDKYVFYDSDTDDHDKLYDCPIVAAAAKHDDQYYDYRIVRVEVHYFNESSYACVYGIEKEYGDDVEQVKVVTGHTEFIIDDIPATDTVTDVTTEFDPAVILTDVKK